MSECVAAHGCITCGDVAVTLHVVDIDLARGLALCADAHGERSSVEIALVEPVALGETLLVHAGTALGRASGQQTGLSHQGRYLPGAALGDGGEGS
jgi:hydrogenase expression/formation protein HypC